MVHRVFGYSIRQSSYITTAYFPNIHLFFHITYRFRSLIELSSTKKLEET